MLGDLMRVRCSGTRANALATADRLHTRALADAKV
jgi:hypothetical protein